MVGFSLGGRWEEGSGRLVGSSLPCFWPAELFRMYLRELFLEKRRVCPRGSLPVEMRVPARTEPAQGGRSREGRGSPCAAEGLLSPGPSSVLRAAVAVKPSVQFSPL